MRLLITTDTVGGVWTYTRELSEGLLRRGHAVLLVSMGRLPSVDQRAWVERSSERWPACFEYRATQCPLEWMQGNGACYSGAEDLLLDEVTRFAPDVLHLNQFCFGALATRIPKLVVAHSDVMSWSQACRGRLPEDSPWFRHYRDTVTAGLENADALAAPTRWMLEALRSHYGLPALQAVIPNGRSLAATAPEGRRLQAVTLGRLWDEGKNIRILDQISSPMPLLVAGELSLEQEAPPASTRLQFAGALTEDGTLGLLRSSAIYIVPSLYEPFGLAPLEAALCGCALLAHDIPSLREVWGDGALYFKSASELSGHLHALHADAALLRRAATLACARARALYSQDAMIENYLAVYTLLGACVEEAALVQHAG